MKSSDEPRSVGAAEFPRVVTALGSLRGWGASCGLSSPRSPRQGQPHGLYRSCRLSPATSCRAAKSSTRGPVSEVAIKTALFGEDRGRRAATIEGLRDWMATQYTDPTARSDPFGSWAASPDFPDAQTYNFAMPKRSPNFELNLDA
jgi:hypothetical protein